MRPQSFQTHATSFNSTNEFLFVIPALARHSRSLLVIPGPFSSFPVPSRHSRSLLVIPAKAGIQPLCHDSHFHERISSEPSKFNTLIRSCCP